MDIPGISETRLWGVCGWFGPVASSSPSSLSSGSPEAVLAGMADPAWRQDQRLPGQRLPEQRLPEQRLPEQRLRDQGLSDRGLPDRGLTFASPEAAVFLSPGTPGAGLATADGLSVAVFGQPRWSSPHLQDLAAATGHANAALEAYGRHDLDVCSQLHGPFGLIVLDCRRRRALVAIDRAGIYPMYHASDLAGGLVFATTATALARHPAMGGAISPQGLFDYLFFYRVPAPGSIFRGQRKLLPGQSVVVQDNRRETRTYWQMPFTIGGDQDAGRLKTELFGHLRTAVGRGVAGEDLSRTGAFLSGGLDSSTVLGLLAEMSAAPVKAFTVGFEAEAYDETEFAKTAARAFGADHHVYRVTDEDVVSAVQSIAMAYDEPFGNASAVPVYFCARFAREHGVDLLLAGDGGDELFAGNKVYLQMKVFELYGRIPGMVRRRFLEPLANAVAAPPWLVPLRKAQRYIAQANVPMPDRMFREELAQFARADALLVDDLAREVDPLHPLAILREAYERPPDAALEQRMHNLEQQVVLADNDLRKVNRMCELAAVRVRFPILDEEVMEFSARIPPQMFMKGFELRAFYKRALRGYLPEKTIRKRKHGFGLPYGPLLETGTQLHDLAYDSLASLKGRGYLRADYIDDVATRHRRQTDDTANAASLWDLMMLELWCQSQSQSQAQAKAQSQSHSQAQAQSQSQARSQP